MKKALVFVLILGFIGTLAFAQSVTWNGYVNSGVTLFNQGSTSSLIGLGSDSWIPGGRFQLEGHYKASNWGWAFRMRSDDFGTPYIKRAYGYVDVLNNMVTLQAGKLGDYTWSSNGWQSFGNFDGVTGIQVQLKPTAGANLGVFLPTGTLVNTLAVEANGALPTPFPVNSILTNSLSNDLKTIVLGGTYSMDKMGYVAAGYDLGNKYFWAGLSYTGMQNLTAIVEMKYNNTATTALNYFYSDQQIGYNMAPYNFNLWAEEQFNSNSTTNTIFHLQPSVDYTINNWDVGAFFSFLSDGTSSGYGPGVWAKATVAKGATVALGGEYDAGTALASTLQSNMNTLVTGNYDPLGGPFAPAALATQSNASLRAYVDFVLSF